MFNEIAFVANLLGVVVCHAKTVALLSRTPKIFAKTYDRGKLEAEFPAPGRIVATLTEWPDVPHFRLLATAAGVRTVLRLTGRRDVVCDVERTADGAIFHGRWTK